MCRRQAGANQFARTLGDHVMPILSGSCVKLHECFLQHFGFLQPTQEVYPLLIFLSDGADVSWAEGQTWGIYSSQWRFGKLQQHTDGEYLQSYRHCQLPSAQFKHFYPSIHFQSHNWSLCWHDCRLTRNPLPYSHIHSLGIQRYFQASLALLEGLHWEVPGRHPNQCLIHPYWLFSMQMSRISSQSYFRMCELLALSISINLHNLCRKPTSGICVHVLHHRNKLVCGGKGKDTSGNHISSLLCSPQWPSVHWFTCLHLNLQQRALSLRWRMHLFTATFPLSSAFMLFFSTALQAAAKILSVHWTLLCLWIQQSYFICRK